MSAWTNLKKPWKIPVFQTVTAVCFPVGSTQAAQPSHSQSLLPERARSNTFSFPISSVQVIIGRLNCPGSKVSYVTLRNRLGCNRSQRTMLPLCRQMSFNPGWPCVHPTETTPNCRLRTVNSQSQQNQLMTTAIGNGCKWLVNFLISIWSLIDPNRIGWPLGSNVFLETSGKCDDRIIYKQRTHDWKGTLWKNRHLLQEAGWMKPLKRDIHLLEVQERNPGVGCLCRTSKNIIALNWQFFVETVDYNLATFLRFSYD